MPTFYLDYEGGNDANDGTTFANRWKTITSGATAARIAPGDTIRVMGSPAPTSLGQSASWTNKSATVTLTSALNVLVTNCDTAWTASANVTCTADTSVYRTSTGSAKHAIAAGFTTGKVAYFDLGSNQNYSSYQGVTFWFQVTTTTLAAGVLTLDFCSDAVGATVVDSFAIPAISQVGQWVPVYVNKGSALGSAIRSISINAISDPGTINLFIDNISTTKAPGNDCLTLQSLIGKNSGANEYWWALRAISGTTLTLDHTPSGAAGTASRGYYGTTESVTTYKRETIKTDLAAATTTNVQSVQDSGSAGSVILFSGGWDRTNMSTQTLETWFDGQSGMGRGIYTNATNYVNFEKINMTRYTNGFYYDGSFGTIAKMYIGNCTTNFYWNGGSDLTINELHVWGGYTHGIDQVNGNNITATLIRMVTPSSQSISDGWTITSSSSTGGWDITTLEAYNAAWHGVAPGAGGCPSQVHIGTLNSSDNAQNGLGFAATEMNRWRIDTANLTNNAGWGCAMGALVGDLHIGTLTSTGNSQYALAISSAAGSYLVIDSLVSSGNTNGGISGGVLGGKTIIRKSSIAETTKLSFNGTAYGNEAMLTLQNYNGTAGDHRTYMYAGASGAFFATFFSETATRHTASGFAWKLSVNDNTHLTSVFPARVVIGRIQLAANVTKTITAWVYRSNTGLTTKLRVRGGQLDGISTDQVATAAGSASTWEQLSVTVTPTIAGTVELELLAYGGTTYNVIVDDIGVS